jgi:anti-sigma B factor antagonist
LRVDSFLIEIDVNDGAAVVAPVGEIDVSTMRAFDAELRRVETYRLPAIVIDLRRVDFIDSNGLHALLSALRRAASGGWRLALVEGGRQVMKLLHITALDRRFEIVRDPAEVQGKRSPGGLSAPQSGW